MKNELEIIDTIKLLIYKENPSILEKVDFDDDTIFLDPLLPAYFNSKKDNLFPTEMLTEIMQGYFLQKEPLQLNYSYNKEGIAYIPKLGYFKQGQKIDEILVIDSFEIVKTIHPVLEKYFVESYKGHITNPNPAHKSVWQNNYQELEQAILIIKEHLPEFYKNLVLANKKIYLHDNPKILNFTSVETLGMLNFYVLGNNNLIYFIEELIHQGSHNFLYYLVHNKKEYFNIDVERIIMRELTNEDWDYRNVYGAYHGLFTVTNRVESFDILLSGNVFSGTEKHELLGRFTDQFNRFRTGLELLNLEEVYTQKGIELYRKLDQKCMETLNKYEKLKSEFDLSNRDLDFRYEDFCKLNSFEEFLIRDKQEFYKF